MSTLVDAGDYILIPRHTDEAMSIRRIKTRWHQYLQTRNETYDRVLVLNLTKGVTVEMFLQADWYRDNLFDDHTEKPAEHISNVAELTDEGSYKMLVDCRLQYGRMNPVNPAEGRFLVYHDKERLPYQHRFIPEPELGVQDLIKIKTIITSLLPPQLIQGLLQQGGQDGTSELSAQLPKILQDIKGLVGNGLHTFQCVKSPLAPH